MITRKEDGVVTNKKVKNYTGAGVPWTTEETKQFECAMLQHRKDFFVISKMVCVEKFFFDMQKASLAQTAVYRETKIFERLVSLKSEVEICGLQFRAKEESIKNYSGLKSIKNYAFVSMFFLGICFVCNVDG